MQTDSSRSAALGSLDRVRAGLQPPVRRRAPIWPLLLAASFAAIMGVSAAAVMILGPGGGAVMARTPALGDH